MSGRYLVDWVASWDFMAILYSLIAAFIGFLLLRWAGVLRRIRRAHTRRQAIKRFRGTLAEECGLLTVVGRRKGFQLQQVYVPLDTAQSDLMSPVEGDDADLTDDASSYVLVGGPGAGKSTTVKHELLRNLRDPHALPMFLRLRDYVGFESIEQYLAHKLRAAGLDDALDTLRGLLHSSSAFCVLDGLDEVRPQLRETVIAHVNTFYHKYFLHGNRLITTCRKEAYRRIPLDIPVIREVRPLTDQQIQRFASKWPLGFPAPKTPDTFWRDLTATARILELARSPLLLVGGLMQYTESNLGIPEERFEYLERVARWLTVEWGAAQGHPPDQYRQVYDRLLARFAYHLHKEQRSDLERPEAERLFREWLPTFGRNDVAPEEVIEAIATRTGVLVSDDRNFLVFAQFGLQEYFASLEVVSQVGPDGLAALEPKEWWREVILLAVAQQREPTPILTALFAQAPLMAAAAVAECPTPSTDIQSSAIGACLGGIDAGDKEAGAAAVLLLRKVQGDLEARLCSLLEERLSQGGSTASVVGIALATAGTACATGILARHPEIWDQCLKEAGYLSTSLENLLVDWIQKGTEFQSGKASELIAARLSMDRLLQLLNLLPSLDPGRAERLAAMILDQCGRALRFPDPDIVDVPCSVASRCTRFIRNRDEYLSDRVQRIMARLRSDGPPRAWPTGIPVPYLIGTLGLVGLCLYMEDRKGNPLSEDAINRDVHATLLWAKRRWQFIAWGLSATMVGTVFAPFPWNAVGVLACVVTATAFSAFSHSRLPWTRYAIFVPTGAAALVSLALVGAAAVGGFMATGPKPAWLCDVLTCGATALVMAASFLVETCSRVPYGVARLLEPVRPEEFGSRPSLRLYSPVCPVIFLTLVFSAGITDCIGQAAGALALYFCVGGALAFVAWIATAVIGLTGSSGRVTRAAELCKSVVAAVVDGRR